MNVQEVVQSIKDLYPPIRTRSGRLIKTTELERPTRDELLARPGLSEEDDRHGLVIKTLFPKSALRRTPVTIVLYQAEVLGAPHWALRVKPAERIGMTDALRFAQLLKARLADKLSVSFASTKVVKTEDGPALELVSNRLAVSLKAKRPAQKSEQAKPEKTAKPEPLAPPAPTTVTANPNGERS